LVEDQASGQQLIPELRAFAERGVPVPIARKTEGDKVSRVEGISAMVEAGQLLLPVEAHWLAELKSELLSFPNGRFDDQVDAVAQLLNWVRIRQSWNDSDVPAGPIIFTADEFGRIHVEGDDGLFGGQSSYRSGSDPWLD
jgi:phage terminase large subunit-like protein